MALIIEFSRRSTSQLHKILEFYDERNGSDTYSRRFLRCLLEDLQRLSETPTARYVRYQVTDIQEPNKD